jgi:hypothetical protein
MKEYNRLSHHHIDLVDNDFNSRNEGIETKNINNEKD